MLSLVSQEIKSSFGASFSITKLVNLFILLKWKKERYIFILFVLLIIFISTLFQQHNVMHLLTLTEEILFNHKDLVQTVTQKQSNNTKRNSLPSCSNNSGKLIFRIFFIIIYFFIIYNFNKF